MAYARATHEWPDKSVTVLEVGTEADGPDALDECASRILSLYRECVGIAEPEVESS